MLVAQLLANAGLGALLAFAVLRADHHRRDNQLLALTFTLDNFLLVGVAYAVAAGASVVSSPVVRYALVCRVLLVHPLLEFAYAFPAGLTPPRRQRALGLAATGAALALALTPATAAWFQTWSTPLFFLPYAVTVSAAFASNLRRLPSRRDASGVRIIFAAVLARWLIEVVMLVLRRLSPDLFALVFAFDLGIVTFAFKVVLAITVLRHGFFRIQGLIVESVLWTALGLAVLGLVAGLDELALTLDPLPRRALLLLAGLTPCLLWAQLHAARPQLEAALLSPFDPHRSRLRGVLERVLRETATRTEPSALCTRTTSALEELSGGRAAFLPCAETGAYSIRLQQPSSRELNPQLSKQFEDTTRGYVWAREPSTLAPELAAALAAEHIDLLVPVRFRDKLLGALTMTGGEIDRETAHTAVALAGNLGTMLTHAALYEHAWNLQRQIDETQHLTSLGSFAAAIAHDLRTPLTSVQINLQMIRSGAALDDDHGESADIALAELKRMAEYLSGILDYSKPVRLERRALDLGRLISHTVDSLEPVFDTRRITIAVNAPALPVVWADAERLRQVLVNLLENAAAASQPGATICVQLRRLDDGRVAFDVSDRGCGIAAGDLEHIFDPFFTTRLDGTGLGLAIAKKLVLAHAGELRVHSEQSRGSTFTVVLPVAASSNATRMSRRFTTV